MSKRPEDLTDDELRALADDLSDRIDVLDNDGNGVPDDLVNEWSQADREISRRAAVACRKAGGYSATFNVDGEALEYELKATNEEDAQAEAKSGATAMAHISHCSVTVERINGPIAE